MTGIFIEDEVIEKIMTEVGSEDLKIAISGPKGVFDPHLHGLDERRKKQYFTIQSVLDYFTVSQHVTKNKYEDKMMVNITNHAFSNKERTQRLLFGPDVGVSHPWYTTSVMKLQLRAQIMASMALCGIIAGTRVAGYDRLQTPSQRLYWLNHEDIYNYLRQYMRPTGNFKQDFLNAFYVFWFKGTQDMTGNDETIKRVFLEEHINFFPE